jgi:hypothetical protein
MDGQRLIIFPERQEAERPRPRRSWEMQCEENADGEARDFFALQASSARDFLHSRPIRASSVSFGL